MLSPVTSTPSARIPETGLSARKRIAFSVILVLFLWAAVEMAAFVAYGLVTDESFSLSAVQSDRAEVIERFGGEGEAGWEATPEVIHPYVGYVSNPDRAAGLSQFGYPRSSPLSREPSDERVVIAVVGGSVAQGFARSGMPAVVARLEKEPSYAGKQIVTVDLAAGGYKQPQQLMTLTYLLSLGFEFDVVLNIDGFNEVALHGAENGRKHVFPAYPRGWYLRVSNLPNRALRAKMGRVAGLEEAMVRSAERFSRAPWRWSPSCNLLWRLRQDWLDGEHAAAFVALTRYEPKQGSYVMTGPRVEFSSDAELYDTLVDIWKQSSLQLDRLCKANGIRYYHFLQPNQYLEGSKVLTAAERERAFTEDHPYRAGVEQGYPRLVRAGAELREQGVRFFDLTRVFADETASLYVDDCCHFNETGNLLIADRVARELLGRADYGQVPETSLATTLH
jgi:hypothetical protein